ncbi:MAG: phage holin family protein [Thermoleophilia bacterium]
MRALLRWAVNTIAIVITAYLLPAVEVTSWKAALIAGLLLGILNTFVRPVFRLLALPITILTLGLFILVVNGFILEILDWLMDGFNISGFLWAIVAALLIGVVTSVINIVLGTSDKQERRRG